MWKSYFTWRKNVRTKAIIHSQLQLLSNLFLINENLQQPLLKVREICLEISKLRLYKIQDRHAYTLSEFMQTQVQQKEYIQERLEFYFNQLKEIVADACENSLEAHGLITDRELMVDDDELDENGVPLKSTFSSTIFLTFFSLELTKGISGAKLNLGDNLNLRDVLHKSSTKQLQSLIQKDNNPMLYTQLAAKRTECRRLTACLYLYLRSTYILVIKLADYLLIDTLHVLCLNSVRDILHKLGPVDSKLDNPLAHGISETKIEAHSGTMLKVQVVLGPENELLLSPDTENFNDAMDNLIASFVDSVVSVPKLLQHVSSEG